MISVHTIVVEWVLCVASLLVLLLRIYVRTRLVKVGIQREEFILIFAQALFFVWISMDTFTISKGFMNPGMSYLNLPDGFHTSDQIKIVVLKVVYASSVPYYLCLWSIKFSLLSLYYRLIPKGTRTRNVLHFTTGLATVSTVTIIFLNLFLCQPLSLNWKPTSAGRKCYASTSMTPFIVSVLLNLFVDILIFILPFSVLRKIKSVERKQKIGLIATFSIGIVTIAIIITRAVILAISGSVPVAAMLTAIECFTSMVVACLPVMRPLFKAKFRWPHRRRYGRSGNSGGKLSDDRYANENDDDDDDEDDLESTISYNEDRPMPLGRLEKSNAINYNAPLPELPSPHHSTTVVTRGEEGNYDDYEHNSPANADAMLHERMRREQEFLHRNHATQQGYSYYPMPSATFHQSNNSFPISESSVPSYVSNTPLPVPPPPSSQNQQEYIVPSYILNEPLPNPVI